MGSPQHSKSEAAFSGKIWVVYLVLAGLGSLLTPNSLLPIFGLPKATEVWILVPGLVVAILEGYYFRLAGGGTIDFLGASVGRQLAFAVGISPLVALGISGVR